jgi:hypothetical protein
MQQPEPVVACRLPGATFSVADLVTDLERLRSLHWIDHVNQRDYAGAWDVLPLRCLAEHATAHPVLQGFALSGDGDWSDLPALQSSPAIRDVLAQLHCPLHGVRLMRLRPGSEIKPHRDRGLAFELGEARLHLPILTDPDVRFIVNGRELPMRAGELWYVNTNLEHAVYHRGRTDRVHLVIDCAVNAWLTETIRQGEP